MAEKMNRFFPARSIVVTGWVLITLAYFAYFLTVLQLDFYKMLMPCQGINCSFLALSPAEITALTSWGMSTRAYAYFISSSIVLNTLVYFVLGGLIILRQGRTRVGLAISLALIIIPIATYGGSTDWATNYPDWAIPGVLLNIFGTIIQLVFFYLIPNGKFSPRWAYIPFVITMVLLIILVLQVNGFVALSSTSESLLGTTIIGFIILAGIFHFYRYRRESNLLERQQTKWMLFGVLTYILSVVLWVLVFGEAVDIPPGKPRLLAMMIGWFAINDIVGLGLPVAITIASMRYRLWDLDLVIRRTLQYALLSGLLALVYFSSVIFLQSLTKNLFREQSPLVIVFSTLAIAALFNPLRTLIQDFIDRRFYRKKYNTELALVQFAATARDEVDMDKLTAALLGVVEETIQPESLGLWLKLEENKRS